MEPSPLGGNLNTPAGGLGMQSPRGGMTEEQLYLDKIKQLSKYIEPLQGMVDRINEGKR